MESVAFYSYKGGSGRSTACVNFIYFFAKKVNATPQNPIVVVDCDIDSAGLTYLFQRKCQARDKFVSTADKKIFSVEAILCGDQKGNDGVSQIRGINDYPPLIPITNNAFFADMIPVGDFFDLDPRTVLFLPHDKKMSENNFNASPARKANFVQIKKMAKRYKCSGLIFDCPAGTQELALWSLESVDNIICCMRPTYQFRCGSVDSMKIIIDKTEEGEEKQIIICPNAVSRKNMTFYNNSYPSIVRPNLKEEVFDVVSKYCKEIGKDEDIIIRDEMLYNSPTSYVNERSERIKGADLIGIPEVERFKWFEECLGTIKIENDDEELAIERYKYLASLVK